MPRDRSIEEMYRGLFEHYKVRAAQRQARFRRAIRPRESLATLMLGTPALALTGALLVTTLLGLSGFPQSNWNVPRQWMAEEKPLRYESYRDEFGNESSAPALTPYATVYMPSDECISLGFAGMGLSFLGLMLSYHQRRLSWMSALALLIHLLAMLIVIACSIFLRLM